jgi:hypothetical protein
MLQFSDSYPYMPLWAIGILFFAALLVAREIGYALRRSTRPDVDVKDDAFAMNSVLGLLALLVGFTFSISLGRYDTRRELVVQEANALGTTWLRAHLLDASDREALQDVLRRYVADRIAYADAANTRAETEAYARTEALQVELWDVAMRAVAPFRDTPRASLLVTPVNESIDLAATRQATRQSHIPTRILRMLAIFALISAAMVGYERGGQRRATTLQFLLLALAVTLVLDLDRPSTGMTIVSQQPMLDLQNTINQTAVPRTE